MNGTNVTSGSHAPVLGGNGMNTFTVPFKTVSAETGCGEGSCGDDGTVDDVAVPLLANDDESSAPEQHDLSSSMPSNETETSNGDTTTAQQLQGTNIEDVEDGDGDQSESQAPQAPPPEENTRSSSTPSGGGGGGTIAPEHDEQYRRVPRATMQVHLEEGAS